MVCGLYEKCIVFAHNAGWRMEMWLMIFGDERGAVIEQLDFACDRATERGGGRVQTKCL